MSVRVAACATTLPDRHEKLSVLICNAGVMGGHERDRPRSDR
jgi:NADP-dependent 3-hydroxy acid dehydrogenase YdfG